MENTKVTLNDLEAFVSKLGAFVDKLESERMELTKNTFGMAQKVQEIKSSNQ
jgi:hypothetical protein